MIVVIISLLDYYCHYWFEEYSMNNNNDVYQSYNIERILLVWPGVERHARPEFKESKTNRPQHK